MKRLSTRHLSLLCASILIPAQMAQAAVVGEPERLTVPQWAAAHAMNTTTVDARYAAAGGVTCVWEDDEGRSRTGLSSGQVTVQQDLITVSAHIFVDLYSCELKAMPSECTFTVEVGGEVRSTTMEEIEDIGVDCDRSVLPPLTDRYLQDWAVVRLAEPLDVQPYGIREDDVEIVEGERVTSTMYSQDYFHLDRSGRQVHPKTVGDCAVHDVVNMFQRTTYFATDCDGAQRSSGGSVLDDTGPIPLLIGIWAASTEDRPQLEEAIARVTEAGVYRDDLANSGPYDVDLWSSRHVPVAGRFSSAIREAAGLN